MALAGEAATSEGAMTAVLGLGLSVLITIALLGWLIAQDH